MFCNDDLVKIKEQFRNPDETDLVYRVVNVNEATNRCYIELAESNLPLNPQELVSFEMLHLHKAAPIRIKVNEQHVLLDDQGTQFTPVTDSIHLMSQKTGEIYRICKLDEKGIPVEIEPLHQHVQDVEQLSHSICEQIDVSNITETARVSVLWNNYGIAVDLNYAYSEAVGYSGGDLTYADCNPDVLSWEDAKSIGKLIAEYFNLPLDIDNGDRALACEEFLKSLHQYVPQEIKTLPEQAYDLLTEFKDKPNGQELFYIASIIDGLEREEVPLETEEMLAMTQRILDISNCSVVPLLTAERVDAVCTLLNNGMRHTRSPEFPEASAEQMKEILFTCDIDVFAEIVETVALDNQEFYGPENQYSQDAIEQRNASINFMESVINKKTSLEHLIVSAEQKAVQSRNPTMHVAEKAL